MLNMFITTLLLFLILISFICCLLCYVEAVFDYYSDDD